MSGYVNVTFAIGVYTIRVEQGNEHLAAGTLVYQAFISRDGNLVASAVEVQRSKEDAIEHARTAAAATVIASWCATMVELAGRWSAAS